MLCFGGTISAQSADRAEYQVYVLRHKAADDVEKILAEMLPGLGATADLVADRRSNKILLRGPESVQQIARQLIQSVDRVEAAAGRPESLVRAYPCAASHKMRLAASLRAMYAERPDVRVATDPRLPQLWIVAPADVHAVLPRQLASLGTGVAPRQQAAGPGQGQRAGPAAGPQTRLGPQEHFVRLIYGRVSQIESMFRDLFGRRLEPLQNRQPGRSDYLFVDSAGNRITLGMDRQRNGVVVYGQDAVARQFVRLVHVFDAPRQAAGKTVRIMPVQRSDPAKLRQAVEAYRSGYRSGGRLRLPQPAAGERETPVRKTPLAQPGGDDQGAVFPLHGLPGAYGRFLRAGVQQADYLQAAEGDAGQGPLADPIEEPLDGEPPVDRRRLLRELDLDVEIEALPELDVIILHGRDRDVEEIARIIEEIERLSAETEPVIDVYFLQHVGGEALVSIVQQINKDLLGGRQGRVSVTPLVKPNALLLIGWGEAVDAVKQLIRKLDRPVAPETQLRVFRLRHAPAAGAMTTVQGFFGNRTGLGPQVMVTADPRTNSLLVQAAPRDMAEVELLVQRLDQVDSQAVMQTQIFKLKNSLAVDLGGTLEAAIRAAAGGVTGQKSAALELLTIDAEGEQVLKSGILTDVQITPDQRINALLVIAPAESMDLIAALIDRLDSPAAVAQIKVFSITNGDANELVEMLRTLLPGGVAAAAGPQLPGAEGETSLIPVRFSVDSRTNSIIATGSEGDLRIIEALLLRLDAEDVQQRQNSVYRLRNAPAPDVARAINDFLRSERQVQQAAPGALSPFQRIESEVVVVPELVSNALIISATPRFFNDIMDLVEQLDAEPPQVMIQVLIAEVSLGNIDEFGVEVGLQDSILFDRSLLSELLTTTSTAQQSTPAGIVTATQEIIQAATNTPGFNFNNQPLGNSGSSQALAGSHIVGNQGLSSFAVGRMNPDLGYGGLVLSASSESVSVLIRALQETRRLDVLARPQIMTLDNQPAWIQVGKRVPRITGTTINEIGQVNNIEMENVGLIMGVTPRISPEGTVVMEIDAEKSELSHTDGVPVAISEGKPIMSPSIALTMAQTTVSAASGDTVVIGGLITKSKTTTRRRVPWLADVPVLGNLFRYDSDMEERSELLIVLTPHVVRTPADVERLKQAEAARMQWCLADVNEIHGHTGLCDCGDCPVCLNQVDVIYPDSNPRGIVPPEPQQPVPQTPVTPMPVPMPTPGAVSPPGDLLPGNLLRGGPEVEPPRAPIPEAGGSSQRVLPPRPILNAVPLVGPPVQPIPSGYAVPPGPVAPAIHAQPIPPTYSQPTYTQPTYMQPTYTQPTYTQPAYTQPGLSRLPNVGPGFQQGLYPQASPWPR